MRLVIGGAHQGKRDFILARMGLSAADCADLGCIALGEIPRAPVCVRYHLWIRRLLENEMDPLALTQRLLLENPDVLIICDEMGCGIVPMDHMQRQWREQTGRLLCLLAARAQSVERVFCGISTVIK